MTETEERRLKVLKIVEEMTDNLETPHGFLPSGSCVLDAVLGGGYPYGKFTMIYGKFAGGKTSLGTIASLLALKRGGLGIILDVERKFNMHYAKKLGEKYGVNAESLIVIKPESLENCLSIIDELILSNYKGQTETVIFWDSLTASCGEDIDYKTGTKKNARGVSTMVSSNWSFATLIKSPSTSHPGLISRFRIASTTWSWGIRELPAIAASSRVLTLRARTRRASVPASKAVGSGRGCFSRMVSSGKTPRSTVQTLIGVDVSLVVS